MATDGVLLIGRCGPLFSCLVPFTGRCGPLFLCVQDPGRCGPLFLFAGRCGPLPWYTTSPARGAWRGTDGRHLLRNSRMRIHHASLPSSPCAAPLRVSPTPCRGLLPVYHAVTHSPPGGRQQAGGASADAVGVPVSGPLPRPRIRRGHRPTLTQFHVEPLKYPFTYPKITIKSSEVW